MANPSEDAPGRCLLVGAPNVCKRALAAALTGASVDQGTAQVHWDLDTKYYTASAVLELSRPSASLLLQGGDAPDLEAVVLVFDAAQEGSWQAVRAWYEAAGGADADDLGVRLAVGVDSGSSGSSSAAAAPPRPAWIDGVEEWCAEQLVEFIKAALAPGATAAAATSAGSDGAVGVARVREALEAHMWPGLRLKPSPQRGGAAAAAAAEQQDAPPAGPAAAAGEAEARGAAAEAAAPQQQQQEEVEDAVPAAANGIQPTAAHGGEEEAEGEVEQLEQLFAQVASHRATLAQLPDAQRREAAAAVVMQLMQAMGLEEDDEEEEEAALA